MRHIPSFSLPLTPPLTLALTLALALVSSAPALIAQMPDSPTGRMAGALLELAANPDDASLDLFVTERLAAAAPPEVTRSLHGLRRECAGGEMAGANKTGASSATLTLALPEGRCEVAFTIESEAPHGLIGLVINVMMGGPPEGGLDLDLPTGDDVALGEVLDRQLKKLTADDEFSGVVLLARQGKPIFHRAYGYANRETGQLNTVETRFDIGSITKLITRIAIAQLAQAGELDLTATVSSVLPYYPNAEIGGRITVQQLLDHSSGLGDIFNERWEGVDKSKLLTPRDFFPVFSDQPLGFEPGSSRSYSNAGFIVLGAIIEAVSGESYTDYLARHIFAPAGMTASGFPLRDGSDTGLAVGYADEDGAGRRPNLGMLPIRGCPAGSSSHTAADLLTLERALRAGRLLDDRWTAWVYTESLEDAGSARDWTIGVAGGGPGVNAILEADDEITAVVVSNFDPPTASQLGRELYGALSH